MAIRPITSAEYPEFIALLERGMRPQGDATRVTDDFPVACGPDNLLGMWGLWEEGTLTAGLVHLVRGFATSAGPLTVAGIGSVVTREDRRGLGHSGALQTAVLADLRRQEVPLAVLWTDRPELYARRGFEPAGWERHVALDGADLTGFMPAGYTIRPCGLADIPAVGRLYERHPLRTFRPASDHAALYAMPGTRGLVLVDSDGAVRAFAFAGKGADFPEYVAEWGGEPPAVAAVLARVHQLGWARHVLVPQGGEGLLALLEARGAAHAVVPSGLWAVLDPAALTRLTGCDGGPTPAVRARDWLGTVAPTGEVVPGSLAIAVWGFDSV